MALENLSLKGFLSVEKHYFYLFLRTETGTSIREVLNSAESLCTSL